ncbi:DMT family transporter [Streptomyces sp. NPDC058045]|uniref:DMT family transporter n=1 Tax=Streptomyces sp. NPDC058045 TaxID=3346311 RepID=UPI0036EB8C85
MSPLAVSVLLSLVSAVAYAGGAILQERVAATGPARQYAPLRRPAWWAAVILNGLGALLHVVALAYGPLSLVQPLGALTIVFALPMAALLVGRRAGSTAWRGALMATVGLAGLLALTSGSDTGSLDGPQRVMVAVVTGGSVVALLVAAQAVHRHPAVRAVLLATAAGLAFGIASVFTKTVAVDWTRSGVGGLLLPSLGVIVVLAAGGLLLSQASYRGAGLAAPLATVTVVNPVIAAAVGLTLFGETFRYGTAGTALALGCGVVAAGGLILLTTERLTAGTTASGETAQPRALPEAHTASPGGSTRLEPADETAMPTAPTAAGTAPTLPVTARGVVRAAVRVPRPGMAVVLPGAVRRVVMDEYSGVPRPERLPEPAELAAPPILGPLADLPGSAAGRSRPAAAPDDLLHAGSGPCGPLPPPQSGLRS